MPKHPKFELRVKEVRCLELNDGILDGNTDRVYLWDHSAGLETVLTSATTQAAPASGSRRRRARTPRRFGRCCGRWGTARAELRRVCELT